MNPVFFVMAVAAQCVLASGQVMLKKAMVARSGFGVRFAAAIGCMTAYFLVWLGLAGVLPLSSLAPFDALGPVIIVAAAHVVLKDRLSARAWAGVVLILMGVAAIARA